MFFEPLKLLFLALSLALGQHRPKQGKWQKPKHVGNLRSGSAEKAPQVNLSLRAIDKYLLVTDYNQGWAQGRDGNPGHFSIPRSKYDFKSRDFSGMGPRSRYKKQNSEG